MAKSSSNNDKQTARQLSAQMRQDAARREKRFRLISIGVLVAAVLGLGIAAVPIVKGYLDEKNKSAPTLGDVTRPSVVNADGGITVGADGVAGSTGGADAVVVAGREIFGVQHPGGWPEPDCNHEFRRTECEDSE